MEQPSVRESSARIDDAAGRARAERRPPAVIERVEELLSCVMAPVRRRPGAHRRPGARGRSTRPGTPLADDELVGNLLVLHDLHPDDVD